MAQTFRLRFSTSFDTPGRSLSGTSAVWPPEGSIYYLTIETSDDIFSVFGPFHKREEMLPALRNKLQQTCPAYLPLFNEELLSFGAFGARRDIEYMYMDIPLPDGNSITVHLIAKPMIEVPATIEGPAWNVICAKFDGIRPTEFSFCGTYTSAEAANRAVQDTMSQRLGPDYAARTECKRPDGTMVFGAKDKDNSITSYVLAKFESSEDQASR